LAICKGIVELHGGTISAASAGLDRGSRFVIELPVLPVAVSSPPASPTRLPPQRAVRARILVVEDEADMANTLVSVLQDEGYEVAWANTAHAALEANLETTSIVISDLGLPDLDGKTMLSRMRAKAAVKAIALSGYGTEADIRASSDAGFIRHLTKPVDLDELLTTIDLALATPQRVLA
jgi:CheY-like chemotaxis protein